jgi:hypothetical protein
MLIFVFQSCLERTGVLFITQLLVVCLCFSQTAYHSFTSDIHIVINFANRGQSSLAAGYLTWSRLSGAL